MKRTLFAILFVLAVCANASARQAGVARKIDEFGEIEWSDLMARLDNFAIELQNDPTAQGYIIAYGGRVGRRGEALKRASRAKGYLTNVRGIPAGQVVIIDGGYRTDLTLALKVRGRGAPPPEPYSTVAPAEVRFIKSVSKRAARRRRPARPRAGVKEL